MDGIGDLGAIDSALSHSVNVAAFADPNLADLAAAYMFGLVRGHGFADGNKRTGWVIGRIFLADNGGKLKFDRLEAIRAVEALAAGTLSEAESADWIRNRLV